MPGDYNGDGRFDMVVFRPDGSWLAAYAGGGTTTIRTVGGSRSDIPVPGDYDGDRRSDMLLYRPAAGQWLLSQGGGGGGTTVLRSSWGGYDDMPVPGDFDGDGSSDLTIFRPRDGSWSVAYAGGGTAVVRVGFGTVGDLSLPASTIPGTPGRTDGLTKPVYFVHGYVWGSGTDCNHSYWANAVADFRLDGDPAYAEITRTVGFYQGDTNCDVRLVEGTHDTPIEELGRLLSWEIYHRYARFGVAVDVVAHSMGGLVTMAAISGTQRNLVGWAPYIYVEDVSTLASPFAGISDVLALGCGAFTHQCSQMAANSAFYRTWSANNPQADGTGTDWTLIGSYADVVVSETSATAMSNPGHKILYYQRLSGDESVTHATITEPIVAAYSFRACDHYRSCDMNTIASWPSSSSANDPVLMARLGSYRFTLS
ncbi:FG-GAP-like repeat-containing protein [Micromonospora chokoriensis]|uniref:FG-GAP-like repeat-containing protein n=1 Tax=Micromonospora chokoriensis TaxID=356851 RepID=UPI00068B7843|nr:FG-GAP-like repeat-containing protein [Micromonospora chokoriensis]